MKKLTFVLMCLSCTSTFAQQPSQQQMQRWAESVWEEQDRLKALHQKKPIKVVPLPREWISEGKILYKGKFVSYKDGLVIVETDEKKTVAIRMAILTEKDKRYVRDALKAQRAASQPPKKKK